MSLLVIFGAGASCDSVNAVATFPYNNPTQRATNLPYYRPPLASELFEDRINFNEALTLYPQAQGRIAELRWKARAGVPFNIEHELELIKQSGETYPPARVELAAIQFYLRHILAECGDRWQRIAHGLTNYAQLLARIDRWRHPRREQVLIATFNYDLLLEQAAQNSPVRLDFNDIASYIKRDDYRIFKPHGSVTWGQLLDNNAPGSDPERYMIDNVAALNFTNQYRVTSQLEIGGRLVYPAIAIPVEGKSDFACPPDHMTTLVTSLADVRHVLIVGWRASEKHFLNNIEGRLVDAKVHVVAGGKSDADATKAALIVGAGIKYPDFVTSSSAGGFSDFLKDDELERFLNS